MANELRGDGVTPLCGGDRATGILQVATQIITASQLRWPGHIIRMNDSRLPQAVFYGELAKGKHLCGGQRLRHKDVVKRHLKATHITADDWETLAQDRQQWRLFTKEKTILTKRYHKNTNMITITVMAFLMLLPLSSSV